MPEWGKVRRPRRAAAGSKMLAGAAVAIAGLDGVRALCFDVQGTCVDFYRPILRAGEAVMHELAAEMGGLETGRG